MMKRIYVLRHGKAEKGGGEGPDFERKLTDRGRENSKSIGAALKKSRWVPERILSSSAARALETAELCAKEAGYQDELQALEGLYSATEEDYVLTCRELPDGVDSVMIVGHNPTIEEFNEALTGKYRKLKTATLAWYDIEIGRWAELDFESTVSRSGMLLP